MGILVKYERPCPSCGKPQGVWVNATHLRRWQEGLGHVQDVFPALTADEREVLVSGTCPTCWDEMFKEDDWEDDELGPEPAPRGASLGDMIKEVW